MPHWYCPYVSSWWVWREWYFYHNDTSRRFPDFMRMIGKGTCLSVHYITFLLSLCWLGGIWHHMSWYFLDSWGGDISSLMGATARLVVGLFKFLVECMLHFSWSRWPLADHMLPGKCFFINEDVSYGNEEKWPLLMACMKVDVTGLNHVATWNQKFK